MKIEASEIFESAQHAIYSAVDHFRSRKDRLMRILRLMAALVLLGAAVAAQTPTPSQNV
jgi:hypothetical protein